MFLEMTLGIEVLIDWELNGQLPDQDGFEAAYKEMVEHQRLAERYRKFIEECQHNENCRHSLPNNSQPLSEDSAQGESFG